MNLMQWGGKCRRVAVRTFSSAIVKSFENFCSNEIALLCELVTLHLTIGDVMMVMSLLIFGPVKVSDGVSDIRN